MLRAVAFVECLGLAGSALLGQHLPCTEVS